MRQSQIGRMGASFREVLMIGGFVATALLCVPGTSSAQCTVGYDTSNTSVNGTLSFQAVTTMTNCSGADKTARVEMDIPGANPSCPWPGAWVGGWCTNESYESNAVQNLWTEGYVCGAATGKSNHRWMPGQPGGTTATESMSSCSS